MNTNPINNNAIIAVIIRDKYFLINVVSDSDVGGGIKWLISGNRLVVVDAS